MLSTPLSPACGAVLPHRTPPTPDDERYMRRCLQLARCGRQNAKPNPMVGAVLVAQGRIIGEGYHVRCGEGHAEVNAFASVTSADEVLLPYSTLYVSLEPCSHHGKTPPCADLIISRRVRRVVVGCVDPYAEVSGRGLQRLADAGIDVTVGVLEDECRELNRRFFTYHQLRRPYIILKWAQTANGFIDDHGRALALSTPFTQMLSHKLRAEEDAILVGRVTDQREHPQLNVRHWAGGPDPCRLVVDHAHPLDLGVLHAHGIQSLIVEGGRQTLQWFVDHDLWDTIRVETAPLTVSDGTPAPLLPAHIQLQRTEMFGPNIIRHYVPLHRDVSPCGRTS